MSTGTATLIVGCIAAVAAITAAAVPLYLSRPRLRLRCVGVERRSEDSVQITVQVHNKGNRAIHSLDLRAALYGQNLNSAQTVGAEIHDLRPDEARRVSFAPAPPAEVGYTDEGLALLTLSWSLRVTAARRDGSFRSKQDPSGDSKLLATGGRAVVAPG